MGSDNLIETSDENLWNELRNGSEKALEIIYQKNYQILFSFGFKLTFDKEIVKDEIQELFTNLWNNHHNLSQVKKIRAYLLKALYNSLIKQGKKSSKEVLSNYDEGKYQVIFSIEHAIIELEGRELKSKKLETGINQLSNREKEIIYLFFYEGYSYKQIEELTDLKYQSIKNLMYRALQRLKYIIHLVSLILLPQII